MHYCSSVKTFQQSPKGLHQQWVSYIKIKHFLGKVHLEQIEKNLSIPLGGME